jgi:hypothetical protein
MDKDTRVTPADVDRTELPPAERNRPAPDTTVNTDPESEERQRQEQGNRGPRDEPGFGQGA